MIQVKILKNKAMALERDINETLVQIGSVPGVKVELQDIKLIESGGVDMLAAMIIYRTSPAQNRNQIPGRPQVPTKP